MRSIDCWATTSSLLLVLIIYLCIIGTAAAAADTLWPQYLHDAQATNRSPYKPAATSSKPSWFNTFYYDSDYYTNSILNAHTQELVFITANDTESTIGNSKSMQQLSNDLYKPITIYIFNAQDGALKRTYHFEAPVKFGTSNYTIIPSIYQQPTLFNATILLLHVYEVNLDRRGVAGFNTVTGKFDLLFIPDYAQHPILDSLNAITVVPKQQSSPFPLITLVMQVDTIQHVMAVDLTKEEEAARVKWVTDVGAMFASDAAPAISNAGDRLYVIDFAPQPEEAQATNANKLNINNQEKQQIPSSHLLGLDMASGKVVLNITLPKNDYLLAAKISLTEDGKTLFLSTKTMGKSDYELYIYAYSTETGKQLWISSENSLNNTYVSHFSFASIVTLASKRQVLYQVRTINREASETVVCAFDAQTGKQLWFTQSSVFTQNCFDGSSIISVLDDRIAVATCDRLVTLDGVTGKPLSSAYDLGHFRNFCADSNSNGYVCYRKGKSNTAINCEKRKL